MSQVNEDGRKQLLGYLINERRPQQETREWVETWLEAWCKAESRAPASRPGPGDGDGREVWVFERNGVPDPAYIPDREALALGAHPPLTRYVPASLASTPASAETDLKAEHGAMLELLRFAAKPDCDVFTTGTDSWFANVGSRLVSAETAEELVQLLSLDPVAGSYPERQDDPSVTPAGAEGVGGWDAAMARWAVECLDAWTRKQVEKHGPYHAESGAPHVLQLSGGRFVVIFWGSAKYNTGDGHKSEDAARIAAAKALRAADDSLPSPPAPPKGGER